MTLILHIIGVIIFLFIFSSVYIDQKKNRMPKEMTIPAMALCIIAIICIIVDLFIPIL